MKMAHGSTRAWHCIALSNGGKQLAAPPSNARSYLVSSSSNLTTRQNHPMALGSRDLSGSLARSPHPTPEATAGRPSSTPRPGTCLHRALGPTSPGFVPRIPLRPDLFGSRQPQLPSPMLPRRPTAPSASYQSSTPPLTAIPATDAPPRADAATSNFADGDLRYPSLLAPVGQGVSSLSGTPEEDWGSDQTQSDIIFVGTGTSEGIPRVSCLTDPQQKCKVCLSAAIPGNKNRRRNTSLLIRYSPKGLRAEPQENGGTVGNGGLNGELRRWNILIDAGKFFYHSALQWFPKYRVRHLDAVVITHSHADAIGGLDCLRDWTNNVETANIPIYVAERDYKVMQSTHYYLVDTSRITPGTAVSQLQFEVISPAPFDVHGLKVTPLPVWHGKGYLSFGYRFGNICYISDVSEIPESTYPLLEHCDLLIIDALRPDRSSSTHFGLPAALEEVRKIRPKRTLFTGMMHNMDHEAVNKFLADLQDREGIDCCLSYDGLRIPVDLP